MKHKHEGWGWMLAVDFFFAGMGGGMLVIAAIIELFIGDGHTSFFANLLGPAFMCVGCGFLVLELGRPLQSWRVFMNPRAILTAGAWIMTLAIIAGLGYAAFGLEPGWFGSENFSWQQDQSLIRKLLSVVCLVTGLVVATYPGILLARHKGRPFWVGPGLVPLFLLSSLVTGAAAHFLSGFVVAPQAPPTVWNVFPALAAGLLLFQLVLWVAYIYVKRTGASEAEAASALKWIKGESSASFQYLFLVAGTLVPLILLLQSSAALKIAGSLLVLLGGVVMRCLVIQAGQDRTWLPGEQKYRSRLPHGDEAFIKAWSKS
jgi:protein NrfD